MLNQYALSKKQLQDLIGNDKYFGDLVKVKEDSSNWCGFGVVIDDTWRHNVTVYWFDDDIGVQDNQRVQDSGCSGGTIGRYRGTTARTPPSLTSSRVRP